MGKRQVKVSESFFDPLNLTHNALALPPIVFCRKARVSKSADLCGERGYSKMKNQILLVNEMTIKIANIIPGTQPQTTGQK
jgi:hypothetical protein